MRIMRIGRYQPPTTRLRWDRLPRRCHDRTVEYPHQRVTVPGRVNLIGEHTDYSGGLALPMAIHLGTTIEGRRGGDRLRLTSENDPHALDVALDMLDTMSIDSGWGRYPAAVAAELGVTVGFEGKVSSTLPIGAGLSSSAALEVAVALALGAHGSPVELAALCQRAEHRASGVPCGMLDQLACAGAGRQPGSALLIDCATLEITPVPLPAEARFVVVDSGERRALEGSPYAERRAAVELATELIGPLRDADVLDTVSISDPVVARRAHHVITENLRVEDFVYAIGEEDLMVAGALMTESHQSLRDDFEVSTPTLDRLVDDLTARPGVYGARLTGAGFGGCVIALCDPDVDIDGGLVVEPASGPRIDPY